MKHRLRIAFSKNTGSGGVVACRHITIRERVLRHVLGDPVRLTVLVPGDSVDEVAISEVGKGVDCETV